jgi:aminoglycoside phosphotransferase (APT) family kinase protein
MADLDRIMDRIQERLGAAAGPPVPLEGGITNRNYRARFGERDYVVRLPGKDTALLGISRDAERIANEAAAGLGIAPAVAAGDDDCLVTAFVVCQPIDIERLRAHPEPAADALRAFHDSGTQLPTRFWVPELLDEYAEIVRRRGGELPPDYEPTRSLARRIAEVLPVSHPVPCHNDLLSANLLTVEPNDRLMLVDWEYAGMGHRLFDLGNLAVNNEFDEDADERLLAAYFGEPPSPGHRAALQLMRIMSDAREAAWGVIQGVISELEFDFGGYAARHFARLRQAAGDPRLEEWFGAAAA